MSLAIYAAPFNENDDYKNNDNMIYKKKQTHNKTQKRYIKENFDTDKVNSVLQSIHQNSKVDEEGENLGEFNPPPKPESSGVKKTIATEQMMNMTNNNNQNMFQNVIGGSQKLGRSPEPHDENNPEGDLDLNNFNTNYGSQKEIEEYYKKFIPNYHVNTKNINKPYYQHQHQHTGFNNSINENDLLMQKLNYMINLLEEQKDERTNNVTEEVVLYSFLGIFIIFIADSFVRVGKYVR
jgi:hypothetical protein